MGLGAVVDQSIGDAHRAEPERASPMTRPRGTSPRPSCSPPTRSPTGSGSPVRTYPYDPKVYGRAAGRRQEQQSPPVPRRRPPGSQRRSGRSRRRPAPRAARRCWRRAHGACRPSRSSWRSPSRGMVRAMAKFVALPTTEDHLPPRGPMALSDVIDWDPGKPLDAASQLRSAVGDPPRRCARPRRASRFPARPLRSPTLDRMGTPTHNSRTARPHDAQDHRTPHKDPGTDRDADQHGHTRSDRRTDSSAHG